MKITYLNKDKKFKCLRNQLQENFKTDKLEQLYSLTCINKTKQKANFLK